MSATATSSPRESAVLQRRLWRRTGAVRRQLAAAAVLGTLTAVVITGIGWALATGIAAAVAPSRPGAEPLIIAGVLFAVRAGLAWAQSAVAGRGSIALRDELRGELLDARVRAGQRAGSTGDLVWRAGAGIDALDGYLTRYLPALVLAVTVPLTVGAAVLLADPLSAVIIALTVPLIPVFMILIGWTTQDVVGRRWRIQSRLAHHFADLVAGLPTLQVFGRARAQVEGLRRINAADRRETMAALRMALMSALVLELVATLSMALVAVAVGLRLVDGGLDLATGLFVLVVAPEVYLAVRRVGAAYHESADGLAAFAAITAVVDEVDRTAPAVGVDAGRQADDLTGVTITLHGVGVDGRDGVPRLAGLDLEIPPGRVTVLTGGSGSGKSTVLAVLTGALAPDRGEVRVGDRWVSVPAGTAVPGGCRSMTAERPDWLRSLAWVPQHPALIEGTVADNLALAAPSAGPDEWCAALDRVAGDGIGLDQPVGHLNGGLSAGEIRRVAVARALLRLDHAGATLVIMDEPTAGLDATAETAVIDELRRRGVTAVVVSHRPAVIAAADRVVRL